MRARNRFIAGALKLLPLLLVAAVLILSAASCGSGTGNAQTTSNTTKLPPGASGETLTATTDEAEVSEAQVTTQEEENSEGSTNNSTTDSTTNSNTTTELVKTVYLSGANFAVVSVTRDDSNEAALTSSAREVAGDFLQLEMTVTNAGDELVDLSNLSFRLWNPAIDADLYEDFYGSDGTYGSYVAENVISATLLDYETLQAVSIKLRVGETVDNVFLFFDLNPQSTARNDGVTMAGTNLIVYDTDTGDQVEINLSGYAD